MNAQAHRGLIRHTSTRNSHLQLPHHLQIRPPRPCLPKKRVEDSLPLTTRAEVKYHWGKPIHSYKNDWKEPFSEATMGWKFEVKAIEAYKKLIRGLVLAEVSQLFLFLRAIILHLLLIMTLHIVPCMHHNWHGIQQMWCEPADHYWRYMAKKQKVGKKLNGAVRSPPNR